MNYPSILKYLYQQDYKPSAKNDVFNTSAIKGHFEIVKFLVENGADIVEHGANIHAENDVALKNSD